MTLTQQRPTVTVDPLAAAILDLEAYPESEADLLASAIPAARPSAWSSSRARAPR